MKSRIKKASKGIQPTGKTVGLIAAAIVTIIIVTAITQVISTGGEQVSSGCGPMNQWIADSFGIGTC